MTTWISRSGTTLYLVKGKTTLPGDATAHVHQRIDRDALRTRSWRSRVSASAVRLLPAHQDAPPHVVTLEPGSLQAAIEARGSL
jgi:hypothetical protein